MKQATKLWITVLGPTLVRCALISKDIDQGLIPLVAEGLRKQVRDKT